MHYRVTNGVLIPFKIGHTITEKNTEVSYNVWIKSTFSHKIIGKDVILKIPVPPNTANVTFAKNIGGKTKWNKVQNCILWKIKKFPGASDFKLEAKARRLTGVDQAVWSRPPITADFQVGKACSGLAIRFLMVVEHKLKYETVKWVRYMTRAGQYQLRI